MLIAKKMIELMDATKNVTLPFGKQSTFQLSIPLTLGPSNFVDLIVYQRVNIL